MVRRSLFLLQRAHASASSSTALAGASDFPLTKGKSSRYSQIMFLGIARMFSSASFSPFLVQFFGRSGCSFIKVLISPLIAASMINVLVVSSAVPKWVADNEVSACMLCTKQFSMTKRRHHCRYLHFRFQCPHCSLLSWGACSNCGTLVCQACSSHKLILQTNAAMPQVSAFLFFWRGRG